MQQNFQCRISRSNCSNRLSLTTCFNVSIKDISNDKEQRNEILSIERNKLKGPVTPTHHQSTINGSDVKINRRNANYSWLSQAIRELHLLAQSCINKVVWKVRIKCRDNLVFRKSFLLPKETSFLSLWITSLKGAGSWWDLCCSCSAKWL